MYYRVSSYEAALRRKIFNWEIFLSGDFSLELSRVVIDL